MANDLIALVEKLLETHRLRKDPATRLLDLQSELGELAKEHLKATNYGERPFTANDHWREELGDVYFSLLALAIETKVDPQQALQAALNKYTQRLAQRGSAGSS